MVIIGQEGIEPDQEEPIFTKPEKIALWTCEILNYIISFFVLLRAYHVLYMLARLERATLELDF